MRDLETMNSKYMDGGKGWLIPEMRAKLNIWGYRVTIKTEIWILCCA